MELLDCSYMKGLLLLTPQNTNNWAIHYRYNWKLYKRDSSGELNLIDTYATLKMAYEDAKNL